MTAIIDSSALVQLLLRARGSPANPLPGLDRQELHAPHVIDPEVVSAIRKLVVRRALTLARASEALDVYATIPIERYPHTPYLDRVWALRDEISPDDGLYVILAAALRIPLITADRRLARAAAKHCEIQLLR